MGRRSVLCLGAVACSCVALLLLLLPAPVQGRAGLGLAGGSGGRGYLLPEPRFRATAKEQRRGVTRKARSLWSSTATAAGRLRAELRSVPGGPDPLHHHGSPKRPEQERTSP